MKTTNTPLSQQRNFLVKSLMALPFLLLFVLPAKADDKDKEKGKPEIKSKSPLYVIAGKTTQVTFYGDRLTTGELKSNNAKVKAKLLSLKETEGEDKKKGSHLFVAEISAGETAPAENVELTLQSKDLKATTQFSIVDATVAEATEKKPSHTFSQAMPIILTSETPSLAISGTVDDDKPSTFSFTTKPGEKWLFRVFAGRGGSPLDAVVRLRDAKHHSLMLAAGASVKDRVLTFAPSLPGTYYLEIMDEASKGGGNFTYRLTSRLVKPTQK